MELLIHSPSLYDTTPSTQQKKKKELIVPLSKVKDFENLKIFLKKENIHYEIK